MYANTRSLASLRNCLAFPIFAVCMLYSILSEIVYFSDEMKIAFVNNN